MKNYTILLAEDEKGTQEELGEILSFMCKEVYIASNGLEAKNFYLEHSPDLIITDIQMPNFSGLNLVKFIRKNDPKTSIAIVSAHTDTKYLLLAVELNLLKYLTKPITKSKLLNLFDVFLKTKLLDKVNLNDTHTFYPQSLMIKTKDTEYTLTQKESTFLLHLCQKNSLINYYEIEDILDIDESSGENAIRQFIKKIRKKLPVDYIKNVRGSGFIKNDRHT